MNTYEQEQALSDRYGIIIMNQIAATFYDKFCIKRVTDRETQLKGVDYFFFKKTANEQVTKQKVDLKFDYYENENFVFETHQQYTGIGEQSWVYHDRDILVAYFKIYQRKVYLMKTSDLQDFMNTDTYKNRKVFETTRKVNGKSGGFKNFKFEEIPVDRIIKIDLAVNSFETDNLLKTKPSFSDEVLYT